MCDNEKNIPLCEHGQSYVLCSLHKDRRDWLMSHIKSIGFGDLIEDNNKEKENPNINIKLTPIPNKSIKNKYIILISVMHGDADMFAKIKFKCKNKNEFIKVMTAIKSKPLAGSRGGDENIYSKWCEDNFGEAIIPYDIKFSGTGCLANIDSVEGFYYDENGVKFQAEVI